MTPPTKRTSGHPVTEWAVMNGGLMVSGPTTDGEALRGLYERLSEKRGLRVVKRTVYTTPWEDAP